MPELTRHVDHAPALVQADLAPLLRRPPYSGTRPGGGARPGARDCAGAGDCTCDGQALRNLAPQLVGWEG